MLTFLFWAFIVYYLFRALFGGAQRQAQAQQTFSYGQSRRYDFVTALLILTAEVMKANGQIKKIELEYVKGQLVQLLGVTDAQYAVLQLRDILKQRNNLQEVCGQINRTIDYDSKLSILHFLYGIAAADGVVSPEEVQIVTVIGLGIGVSRADVDAILHLSKSTAKRSDINDAYKILEVSPTATDEEVKKAYRQMAMKFHPDRVATLGESVQSQAEERFRKVQEAYDQIKQARGMK